MKTRAALALSVLGAATSVFAQQNNQVKCTWTISWAEEHQGSNGWVNGVAGNIAGGTAGSLDPGEGALISLKFNITNADGSAASIWAAAGDEATATPLNWNPALLNGSSGSGFLSGFWNADLNVNGGANGYGSWSDASTTYANGLRRKFLGTGYSAGGATALGSVQGTGNLLTDIQPAQFGSDAAALTHNLSITVWQGLWIPTFDVSRTASFSAVLGQLGLLSSVFAIDQGHSAINGGTTDNPIPLTVQTVFGGSISIPVIAAPSPSSLALLGLGGLVAARRRR